MKKKLFFVGVCVLSGLILFYINGNTKQSSAKKEVEYVNTIEKSKSNNQFFSKNKLLKEELSSKISCSDNKRLSKPIAVNIDSVEVLRNKYQNFLVNHSNRKLMNLSKKERKALGLPPNAYNEQEFLYTADPNLLRPVPEDLLTLQKQLNNELETSRVPGDGLDNQWTERGPNNVGGRTRTLIFAPGSSTKVIAGGTNGGIWINNDITSTASSWVQSSGVPGNMAVSCITVDPQNSNIMYLGTGEVYVGGAVNGNGVYKSTDGGLNWRLIYSSATGATTANMLVGVTDIKAWVNPSTALTEVYFGVDGIFYGDHADSNTFLGTNTVGLYKSTDGLTFTRQTNASLDSPTTGVDVAPCSFVVNSAGELFMGTKSNINGNGGGRVYKCTNGTNWALVRTLSGVDGRVHLVASSSTAGRMFALCENASSNLPVIKRTTDGFATVDTTIALPTSIGASPPAANDFCRGQAFYDLMIGMNPTDENEVYVAGIEIFRTTTAFTDNATGMWAQLTDWTIDPTNTGNATANSLDGVHSDHHIMAFCPTQTSRVVFGCDGGIYYSNDSGNAIGVRNKDYNVTQMYKGSIDQNTTNNKMLAGLQDNGSQLVVNPAGIGSATELFGGDGCWEFIDKQQQYMVTSYVYNTYVYCRYSDGLATAYIANDQGGSDGDFVNQCGLDSNANILYANGSVGATYRIYRYAINPSTGATTFTSLTNGAINATPTYFEPSTFTTNQIFVGLSNGKLLRMTSANGASPAYTSIGDASWIGAVSDIKLGASDNEIYVTLHNYGITNVWYTSNGGTTWASKEGDLPNLPVKAILANPNATNEVILGTDLGIWYTVNFNAASPNWRRANNGMKDVKVNSLDYRSADNTILAATYGRGMWTGQFWQCGATTKTWNGTAWSPTGTPTKKDAVVFTGNYSSPASLDACSVTVNTGVNVVFNAGHSLRVGENVTVNGTGTLTINNNAALVQYTKHAVNTGNIIVKRNSANMIRQDYTAWGAPVTGQQLQSFSPNTLANRFYTYNVTNSGTPATAYTAVANPSATNFAVGKGYMIRVANNWSSSTPASYNGTFTGVPNNGSITQTIGIGNNLLANPYPSPINAKTFLINNPYVNTLYYWTHTVPASGGVYPTNNYASYTMLGGAASANGSAVPNDYIQVGQGFFVQSRTAQSVVFENEFRVDASNSTQFFRNESGVNLVQETEKHRFWINLNSEEKPINQILMGYMQGATSNVDRKIDGLMLDQSQSMIYSVIDDEPYVIQGKGLPFEESDIVKLGLKVTENSLFTLSLENFDGLFENQVIYLKDNSIGAIHNLKESPYTFIANAGEYKDRFEIIYAKPTNSIVTNVSNSVLIYSNNQLIKINSIVDEIVNVEIYDVTGKIVYTSNDTFKTKEINVNVANQVVLVKTTTNKGEVILKKLIL